MTYIKTQNRRLDSPIVVVASRMVDIRLSLFRKSSNSLIMLSNLLPFLFLLELAGCFVLERNIDCRQRQRMDMVAEGDGDSMPRRVFAEKLLFSIAGSNVVQSPAFAMTTDRKTGIALPDPYEIEDSVPKDWSIIDNPFEGSESSFGRLDSQPDSIFYADPRFVEHIDDNAVGLLTDYVSNVAIQDGDAVLDMCSSWTSHFDPSSSSKKTSRFSGLGMNAKELEANQVLTDWVIQDLNSKPELPYKDGTFDTILCQLSIDYLTSPLQVMKEAGRVLKPGGKIHILFSNRLFLSKAVGLWTGADDVDHSFFVASYLHFSGESFGNISAKDLSTRKGRAKQITGDPLYVVTAVRQ